MSLLKSLKTLFTPAPRVDAHEAKARVQNGQALLVDVREPGEWTSGVAERALLLPLSDLMGSRARWKALFKQAAGKEVLLYCASGMRSARAAQVLAAEGLTAFNAGGLGDLAAAGWKVVRP